jgi:hypothetical protein
MTIEATLLSIDTSLKALLSIATNKIPENESGVAGAGSDPVVAQQVGQAIAAATPAPAAPVKRGRGRPALDKTPPVQTEGTTGNGVIATEPTPAPKAPEVDPFAIGGDAPTAPAEKPRTMEEVRAALIVYQSRNTQPAALKLIKDVTGKDTLATLTEGDLPKLFKAAVPAGEFTLEDVKAVLVKAEERVPKGGFAVMQKHGAANIKEVTPDKFLAVINAAHAVK